MHWLCILLTVYRWNTWNIPTTHTVWGNLNWTIHCSLLQPGRRWKWVCEFVYMNAVVTAANSHINNYSKNIISLQPVGPLSSVGPWASAPWSPCINAPLQAEKPTDALSTYHQTYYYVGKHWAWMNAVIMKHRCTFISTHLRSIWRLLKTLDHSVSIKSPSMKPLEERISTHLAAWGNNGEGRGAWSKWPQRVYTTTWLTQR